MSLSGPLGGHSGAQPRGGKGAGQRRMALKGLRIGSYVLISYKEKKGPGVLDEKVDYEGTIVEKRVGSDNRESYVELKGCIRLGLHGEIVSREGKKQLFDTFIEDCEVVEKIDRPLCPELAAAEGKVFQSAASSLAANVDAAGMADSTTGHAASAMMPMSMGMMPMAMAPMPMASGMGMPVAVASMGFPMGMAMPMMSMPTVMSMGMQMPMAMPMPTAMPMMNVATGGGSSAFPGAGDPSPVFAMTQGLGGTASAGVVPSGLACGPARSTMVPGFYGGTVPGMTTPENFGACDGLALQPFVAPATAEKEPVVVQQRDRSRSRSRKS